MSNRRLATFKKLDELVQMFKMVEAPLLFFYTYEPSGVIVTSSIGEGLIVTCTALPEAFDQWKVEYGRRLTLFAGRIDFA